MTNRPLLPPLPGQWVAPVASRRFHISCYAVLQLNILRIWPMGTQTWAFDFLVFYSRAKGRAFPPGGAQWRLNGSETWPLYPIPLPWMLFFLQLFKAQLKITNTRKPLLTTLPSPGRSHRHLLAFTIGHWLLENLGTVSAHIDCTPPEWLGFIHAYLLN